MGVSVFSFIMAVLWSNIFIIAIVIMRKNTTFISNFSIMPLIILVCVCLLRLLFIFELPFSIVIHSMHIFPAIFRFCVAPIFTFGSSGIFLNLIILITIVWIIGTIFFSSKYILQITEMNKFLKTQDETENPQIKRVLNQVIAVKNKNVRVKIIQSENIVIPMITGFFNPTIYLPNIEFKDLELFNILSHEWTHFLHKDSWIKLFICGLCAIFWWNPFSHILKSNINHILEIRCDLKVVSKMTEEGKLDYLEAIYKILRHASLSKIRMNNVEAFNSLILVGTTNESEIKQRFNVILNSSTIKASKGQIAMFYSILAVVFIISNIFILQPMFSPRVEPGEEPTMVITQETSHLKDNGDGTYDLYINGEYSGGCIDTKLLSKEPFSLLDIK